MDAKETFPGEEKLKSRKLIAGLFENGQNYFVYPFKLIYLIESTDPARATSAPVKFGISVPRRKIKSAVERNRIKRRAREAYRRNKSELIRAADAAGASLYLMFIYVGNDVAEQSIMETSLIKHLEYLQNEIPG